MNYFFDAQFKNLLSQVSRVFGGFKYMTGINHTGKREVLSIPCMAGNQSRIVGAINRKNSENTAMTAPFISCWISNISVSRNRTAAPSHVNSLLVQEQKYDYNTNKYTGELGNAYQVERLMPVPYDIDIQVDIWTTNEEMKHQILEQILVLFNPAIDMQKNNNPLDWSAMFMLELMSINYSSRSVPIGDDSAMEITSLIFQVQHFFLNPPAKVKRQTIINTIISEERFGDDEFCTWEDGVFYTNVTSYKNSRITVEDNLATISSVGGPVTWDELFINQNLQFIPDGAYKLKLKPNYGFEFLTAPIIIDIVAQTSDNTKYMIEVNKNTLPDTTLDPIDAVIDPNVYYPPTGLNPNSGLNPSGQVGVRYLILRDIIPGTEAWGATQAHAGSIITTDDGINYYPVFDSSATPDLGQIVRNMDDDQLYIRITDEYWVHVYQGTYNPGYWQLVSTLTNNVGV